MTTEFTFLPIPAADFEALYAIYHEHNVPPPESGWCDQQLDEYWHFHQMDSKVENGASLHRGPNRPRVPTGADKFYVEITRGDSLLCDLGLSVAHVGIDLVAGTIDVGVRDSADGWVMRALFARLDDAQLKPITAIEVTTNPMRSPIVIRYMITKLHEHKIAYDYSNSEPLLHKMRFGFSRFGIV